MRANANISEADDYTIERFNPRPNGYAEPPPEPDETLTDGDLDAELHRLAGLSTAAYERERKAAAKRLGMRVGGLDCLVEAERGDEPAARGLQFPEVEPWSEPVDGAALLDDISVAIREHLVVSRYDADAMALWATHAHAHDAALISARLAITSPTKRCGKTTTLQIMQVLVPDPCRPPTSPRRLSSGRWRR